jgi:hypothetical protein
MIGYHREGRGICKNNRKILRMPKIQYKNCKGGKEVLKMTGKGEVGLEEYTITSNRLSERIEL